MPDPIVDQLDDEADPIRLLSAFYGLGDLDRDCFRTLLAIGETTVDDLAERVDRERSTVYRSVRRLVEAGVAEQRQVNYDQGGYYHVYRPADPTAIADEMQRLLNDWYAHAGQSIGEFRRRYDRPDPEGDRADDADADG